MGGDYYHDQTGIKDSIKQHSLDIIYGGLNDLLTTDSEEPTIADLNDITLEDIDHYLHKIEQDKDIDVPLLRLMDIPIQKEDLFRTICDYLEVTGVPYTGEKKIYLMESADSILSILPIDTTKGTIKICIELLDQSPEDVKSLYSYKKTNKSLDTITFIKFPIEK